MGMIYSVACRDCKVKRDLDKLYIKYGYDVDTKNKAIQYHNDLKEGGRLGVAILVSFVSDHIGHSIVYFNEHWESLEDEFNEYPEEQFWTGNPDKKATK